MKKKYLVVMIFSILTITATGWAASEIISPLVVLPDPGAVIPEGTNIQVYSAPMVIGAVFHDDKTSDTYMLSADSNRKKAITTDSAGNAWTYTDSDALGGTTTRDGTLYNKEILVVTDYYPNGGGYFEGISTVLKDGSFREWPLIHNHSGSASIISGVKNSLFLPAALPEGLGLPIGLNAKMLRSNYTFGPIANLFFGPDGALYVFTSSRNRKSLARIEADGTSSSAVKSDVLIGTHFRAGALYGEEYVVAVDYAPNSGNDALSGIYTMASDGTYTPWSLSQGHSGISDLIPAPQGGYYFTDFENDNIWHITKPDEDETPVLTNSPVALMSLSVNDSGELAAVNWIPGEWWSNGGLNAIYRISGSSATLAVQAPEGSRLFSIAAGKGGVFGTSFYVTDITGGKIYRLEDDNTLTPFITGLNNPGRIKFDPVSGNMVVVCDGQHVLWFSGDGLTSFEAPAEPENSLKGVFFSDFESDNVWFVPDEGENEIPILENNIPPGLGAIVYNENNDTLYALNWAGGSPFGGEDAVYAVQPNGFAKQIAKGTFSHIAMSRGSSFGHSLYVSQKSSGKILKLETNGTMQEIISGLPSPGEISFDPVSGDLIVICDDGKQIVFIGKNLLPPAGGNPGTVGNYFAPAEQPHLLSGNPAITGNRVALNLTGSIIGEFHAVSKRALEGDFDITASIDMSARTLTSGQNRNAVMAVQSNVAGQGGKQIAYIGIYQKTAGFQATGQKYYAYTDTMINGGWGRFNNRAMTDDEPSGMFRIKREASAISTYYMIGTDWVQLSTTNQGFTDRVRVHFSIDTSWEATLGVDHSAVFNEIVPNTPPAISGTPAHTVEEGSIYSFIPMASDPDAHTLTFHIENKPPWADFDTETGALTGMPSAAHIGSTTGIVISVTDGEDTAALPGFDLTVLGTSSISGQVLINIAGHTNLPVKNAAIHLDGTDLSVDTDLEGHFQLTAIPSGNYSATIEVPGLKSLTRSGDLSIKEDVDLGVIYITAGAFTQEDIDLELSSKNETISELNAVIASMFTEEQVEKAKTDARAEIMAVCDPDGDGKIGLEDVIHALNILSAQ